MIETNKPHGKTQPERFRFRLFNSMPKYRVIPKNPT